MSRRFRAGSLERDFHVLFDEKSMWKWPFKDGGILGTLFSLAITTLFVKLILSAFVNLPHGRNTFVAMMGCVFIWELVRVNWPYLRVARERRRLQKKYFPIVQHTEAFDLLQDAIASRRKGTVAGLGSKEETETNLIRLWKAAFAEAGGDARVTRSEI